MENAPGIEIARGRSLSDTQVKEFYCKGLEHVKTKASYIWEKQELPEKWSLSNWSKLVKHSNIEKWGYDDVKAALGPQTKQNQPHPTNRQD